MTTEISSNTRMPTDRAVPLRRLGFGLAWIAAIALFAASCGGSSSDNALSSSAESADSTTTTAAAESTTTTAAAESTTTTAAPESTTTTAAPETSGEGSDPFAGMSDAERAAVLAEMGLTEEQLAQFELLLDTDAGREIMAQGIVEATGITTDQALCIIENGDIIGLMIGVTGGTSEPDNEITASFLRTLDTCDIPLSAFGS